MVDILPRDLPDATLPLESGDDIIVDQQARGVNKTNATGVVDSVAPVASQSDAEVGVDNVKRMTALKTKQSIASEVGNTIASYAAGQAGLSAVQSVNGKSGSAITLVKADVGLGNADNTSDANKPISTATQTALNGKANNSLVITANDGLIGGGDLTGPLSIGLDTESIDSLDKADSAVQSVNGKSGNAIALVKADVGLGNVDNTSDLAKPVSTLQAASIATKFNNPTGTTSQYLRGDGSAAAFPAIPAGTVTNVGMTVPTGLSVAGSPVTSSGIMAITYTTGYQGYTTDEANKLGGIAAGAQVNTVNSVNTKTGSVVLSAADVGAATAAQGALASTAVQPAGLTKSAVGLGNVDNTSDLAKPISTATQTALNGKASTAAVTTTVNGLMIAADKVKLNGIAAGAQVNAVTSVATRTGAVVLTKADVGLGNVDNTSDLAKPISTATQTALNAKSGTAVATTTVNGLMSAADKVKSDSLAYLAFKDSVAVSDIDATGVPSDSTYLRGDGSWAPAGGGGGGGGQVHTVGAGTGIAVNAADPVNPSVALNPASIASLAKADTALQTLTQGANITITGTGNVRTIAATVPAAPVTSVAGKTGAVTLDKGDVGLGNVDNTSDANKPVSTAQAAAINAKVTKAGDTGLGGFTSAGHNLGNLSGTATPVPTATSNFKYAGNNAAFTLAAPTTAGYYTIAILVTNAASGAGAMTATGFSKVHGTFAADANKKQVLTIEVFGSDKILTIREAS